MTCSPTTPPVRSPDMRKPTQLEKDMSEKEEGVQQVLTQGEAETANRLFEVVFPDLVRGVHHNSLKEATEKTVAALAAGLIALREASGNKP